jgi:predicted nucleotidyltransferase
MTRDDAIQRLKQHRDALAALGVKHAYLFGSVAADAACAGSDVDIMVDLDEGPGGRKPLFSAFDLGGIQSALVEIFNARVDVVVRRDALQPGAKLRYVAERHLVDAF